MDDSKVSILIVDDRPDKLLALEAVLEDLGPRIVRAYSGREALRHVLMQEFAVILLDVNMPDMDGFETAQLIRQRPNSAHVPIIFLTAMSDEMHVARGYSLGAVDYMLTPVVPQVLRSKVAVFVELFRKNLMFERQTQSLRRRTLQLQKLAAAAVAINASLSTEKMLSTITDAARDIIGTHQAMTVVLDQRPSERGPQVVCSGSFSDKYAAWRTKTLDLKAVTETIVARSSSPTRMTDVELQSHPDWDIVRKLKIPPVVGGMLAAPLTGRQGNNLGVIYLSDRLEGNFSADDETVLVQLAQMASVAIENTIFAEEREANRLKDEFLSTLSHELRTPLNAIAGWVQLLRMNPEQEDVSHGLEVIERNVKSQTKLIEDLLDLSRISTGKLRLAAKPIRIRQIGESAIEAMRPLLEERQIDIKHNFDSSDPVVLGDPDRLQQVCGNLLNNAIKFTRAGGAITIRTLRDNGQVHLSVSDTGEGIDPDFLPHVFDRFRQADSTSSRRHGGLGIGLTIVQHIVSLHRGSIRAESPGKGLGATFTVSLPLAAIQQESDHSKPNGDGNGDRLPLLENVRILVVDNEPDAREVVAQLLLKRRANVTTAASASEALQLILNSRPDVLVTDLGMPDQDGYALLREVRQLTDDKGGRTPAIALTAYARPEDQILSYHSGFQAHLTKPVDPAELVNTIHRCVTKIGLDSTGVDVDVPPKPMPV